MLIHADYYVALNLYNANYYVVEIRIFHCFVFGTCKIILILFCCSAVVTKIMLEICL